MRCAMAQQKPFFKLLTKQEVDARRKPVSTSPVKTIPGEVIEFARTIANIIGTFLL